MIPIDIAAIIVLYNPDENFIHRLRIITHQVSRVFIINNSTYPLNHSLLQHLESAPGVFIRHNNNNIGIAAALNIGCHMARQENFEWAVTLDQDSTPSDDMFEKLLNYLSQNSQNKQLALIGSNIIDEDSGASRKWLAHGRKHQLLYHRFDCERLPQNKASIVITSGTLTNLRIHSETGGFDEKLFIDLVDIDYCLRLLKNNYQTHVCCEAILKHTVGNKKKHSILGVDIYPTNHSPQRRYYGFRNRVILFKRYTYCFPYWAIYEFLATMYVIVGIVLLEDKKPAKLWASLRGTFDGFFNIYKNTRYEIK